MARLTLLFGFMVLASATLFAQSDTSGSETIEARLNATAFVSGETLYYALHCTDASGKPVHFSKVAYAELVSSDKKTVHSQKIFLEKGDGNGDFFISPSLPSGSYKFIAYTRWMKDAPAGQLCQVDLTVINPFSPLDASMVGQPESPGANAASWALPKSNFGSREKVTLGIPQELAGKGSFSLSVRKKDMLTHLPSASRKSAVEFSRNRPLPELRGELLSGIVRDQSRNPVRNSRVALSVSGKSFIFKWAETDNDGRFHFTLEKPVYTDQLLVQISGENREALSVAMDPDSHPDYSQLQFKPVLVSAQFEDAIKQRSLAGQVENAYFRQKKDSADTHLENAPFFSPWGKTFRLDDYTRFKTFRETMVEVVENGYFTQNGEKYTLHVRDFHPEITVKAPALVLVDGIYLEDATELFAFPADDIESVHIIQGIYLYGENPFDGVISVATKNGGYKLKQKGAFVSVPKLLRPYPKKNYFAPDYSQSGKSRIPDYRSQLAWVPNVETPQVSFYTPDVPGTYEAVIQGTKDDGSPVLLSAEFEVGKPQ